MSKSDFLIIGNNHCINRNQLRSLSASAIDCTKGYWTISYRPVIDIIYIDGTKQQIQFSEKETDSNIRDKYDVPNPNARERALQKAQEVINSFNVE